MKSNVRLVIVLVSTLAPIAAFAQAPAVPAQAAITGIRLGCVSPQQVFSQSAEGKAAMARLSALQEEKARAIEERNKALQSQEQAFRENAPVLNQKARAQRSNAVERFRIDVQRFIQDAQAEITGVQREAESAFVFKFQPAVEKVAREKGLQIVFNLDAAAISWVDSSLDITPAVVEQLALSGIPDKR
jgi:Skp family chaperone for outer membrane proteins